MKEIYRVIYSLDLFLKNLLKIIFIILSFTPFIFCQKFVITNSYFIEYTIDKINRAIYCHGSPTDTSDTIKKVDLKTLATENTNFHFSPPVFANVKPFLIYNTSNYFHSDNNLMLHNIITNSDFKIADSNNISPIASSSNIMFSPNDKYILLPGYVFSLEDSSLNKFSSDIDINFDTDDLTPQWSSDTSFVFASPDTIILEYFLLSGRIDTLVKSSGYSLNGFAYNIKYNILAYSFNTLINPSPQIYLHYKNSNKDSVIFSRQLDNPKFSCWNSALGLTYLSWSSNNNMLSFLIFHYTESSAGVYFYSLDSSKIYKATLCADYPLKYALKWANNDTLIYYGSSDGLIYGFNVTSVITSIKKEKNNNSNNLDFNIINYPNPFNPSTKISFTLETAKNIKIIIYDNLGRKVRKLADSYFPSGSNTVTWDGRDEEGNNLPSGVYYYSLLTDKDNIVKKMVLLK